LLNGGQARATFEVAKRLVKLGHEVTIVCSRFPGYKDQYHEGIFYKHIGLGSKNIKLNNAVWFLALPFAVMRIKADVIIEAFTAPISTCFSPLFTKIPVMGMPTMFEAEQFSKKYHLPLHWIEALGCKFYKYFLAYSPINKAKMERLNPKVHTRIIPNGVSEEMFDVKTTAGDYGFFIGRIDITQKGLDLLISALEIIKDKLPFKIVLAGNGPKEDEDRLNDMIKQKGLAEKVSFVGRVDGQKKIDLLANCAFGLYPSRFEDFPLVPLEFAALGKPLVCFDIPGLAWVPTNASIKAKSFEVQSLAESILKMSTDTQLRQRMSQEAIPFAKKYGWNSIAEQYAEFCHEVIALENKTLTQETVV
jgi:glycogen synthase